MHKHNSTCEAGALGLRLVKAGPRANLLVSNCERFHRLDVAEWLTSRACDAASHANFQLARELAVVAAEIAGFCRAEEALFNARLVAANAAKIAGFLQVAERELLDLGPLALKLGTDFKASLSGHIGSLRFRQRRFCDARKNLESALSSAVGTERVRVLLALANVEDERGEPLDAIRYLSQAFPLIDSSSSPGLALAAGHNLAACLVDLRRPDDARRALAIFAHCYEAAGPSSRARKTWLTAQIEVAEGNTENGVALFEEAYRTFESLGLHLDAAEVCLEHASVIAAAEPEKALIVLERLAPLFDQIGVKRESLAARALQSALRQADSDRACVVLRAYVRRLAVRLRVMQVPP